MDNLSKSEWKPHLKAESTSQYTLTNKTLPEEIALMFGYIRGMESNLVEHLPLAIGQLAALIPPFQKYFTDYDQLIINLNKCRALCKHWLNTNKQAYPVTLHENIYYLYQRWWLAYNDSGVGIKGNAFISRDKRTKNAILQA